MSLAAVLIGLFLLAYATLAALALKSTLAWTLGLMYLAVVTVTVGPAMRAARLVD